MLKAIFARYVFVGLFLSIFSLNTFAADIYLKDLNGKPVANAVLGLNKSQFAVSPSFNSSGLGTFESPEVMDQVDFLFVPRVLVIDKNDWVSFPNSDDVRHHVYSFSEPMPFEIKMFKGSNSSPVQFSKQGIVVLGCNIHDSMIGYIYVQENEYAFISDKDGKISLNVNDVKSDTPLVATVWHPQLSVSESERISTPITVGSSAQTVTLEMTLEQESNATAIDADDRFRNKFQRTR